MTAYHGFAFLIAFAALWSLYARQTVCVRCGGRGGHRSDCPWKDTADEESDDG